MNNDDRDPPTPSGGTDLRRERDAFVRSLFRKGAELTDQLVAENERLRGQVRELEAEAARMRSLLASDSAARQLLLKIEELEHEKQNLLSSVRDAEELSTRFENRQQEMEDELSTLASLFIAADHLHRSLSMQTVAGTLSDLLAQLVGARSWVCFMVEEGTRPPALRTCASGGEAAVEREIVVGTAKTPLGRAVEATFVTGEMKLSDQVESGEPRAAVPLRIDDAIAGVILVVDLHPHKDRLTSLDRRLFELMSVHVAPALRAASLFRNSVPPRSPAT